MNKTLKEIINDIKIKYIHLVVDKGNCDQNDIEKGLILLMEYILKREDKFL